MPVAVGKNTGNGNRTAPAPRLQSQAARRRRNIGFVPDPLPQCRQRLGQPRPVDGETQGRYHARRVARKTPQSRRQRVIIDDGHGANPGRHGAAGRRIVGLPARGVPRRIGQRHLYQYVGGAIADPPPQVTPLRRRVVKIKPVLRRIAPGQVNRLRRGRFPVPSRQSVRVGGNNSRQRHAPGPGGGLPEPIQRGQQPRPVRRVAAQPAHQQDGRPPPAARRRQNPRILQSQNRPQARRQPHGGSLPVSRPPLANQVHQRRIDVSRVHSAHHSSSRPVGAR